MKPTDFAKFFAELHGHAPFPWQVALAEHVCASGSWPAVIDLPTGAGKTACIDVALFHLLVAHAKGACSAAARRIVFVVDRRIIVDEAEVRAQRMSAAIEKADGWLAGVRHRLREISGGDDGEAPFEVIKLRGGVPRERNLVRNPLTPTVVLSTVDQIGSRLLFRGYGVSQHASPMHAGIFGFDTLLLLDEAHIAQPFLKTLEGIVRVQSRSANLLGVKPLRVSQLSATPGATDKQRFTLTANDHEHPTLGRRLRAAKKMRLLEVAKRDDLPKELTALVTEALTRPAPVKGETHRVGVVVNRVASARDTFEKLRSALKDKAEVHLIIGRSRASERDDLMRDLSPRVKSNGDPRPGELPIVVVATQTIEVGADFDFSTMFVEAASYPAVRQRLGRLNRLGHQDEAIGAIVLVNASKDQDPLYGDTIGKTWDLLQASASDGVVDLALVRAPEATVGTVQESDGSPVLTGAAVTLLAQTSPRPPVEPDVAALLHGYQAPLPEVSVVWRHGIGTLERPINDSLANALFEALPPLSDEAVSLPLSLLRTWLANDDKGAKQVDGGDVEGDRNELLAAQKRGDGKRLRVWEVRGRDVRLRSLEQVKPGSLVVVPSEVGGHDAFGFSPSSTEAVADLSLQARRRSRRSAALVFTTALARSWIVFPESEQSVSGAGASKALAEVVATIERGASALLKRIEQEQPSSTELLDELREWFAAHEAWLAPAVREVADELLAADARPRLDVIERDNGAVDGVVLRARRPTREDLVGDEDLLQTATITLDNHCAGVGELAGNFARGAGLSEELASDLALAGRLHDIGKAESRFQAMLGWKDGPLLAKSTRKDFDRRTSRGARHEVYSVALLDRHPDLLAEATDPELVRHLIGAHHGRGRALQSPSPDRGAYRFEVHAEGRPVDYEGRPTVADVDARWADSFAALQNRYGAWGLAYLETLLRLADHRRSELELAGEAKDAAGASSSSGRSTNARATATTAAQTTLELDGLIGSHPLGALASFGLLRVVSQFDSGARLHFDETDDWMARLHSTCASVDSLIDRLDEWVAGDRERLLEWTGDADVRIAPAELRRLVDEAERGADREQAAFLAALATDGAVDGSKGLAKPSSFYMVSGQQSFVDTMKVVLRYMREKKASAWREALLGPWEYSAPVSGAGWDPGTERMYALRYRAPGNEQPTSVAGAMWLAFEALPLFPVFSQTGRERTVGFHVERRRSWRWPVPSRPVTLDTLAALVATELAPRVRKGNVELHRRRAPDVQRVGLGAVYESLRHESGKGYGVFKAARRIL